MYKTLSESEAIQIATEGIEEYSIFRTSLIKLKDNWKMRLKFSNGSVKKVWFVSYLLNDLQYLASIYIDAETGSILESKLLDFNNGKLIKEDFLIGESIP
jgi:hypothetical protein